MDTLSSAVAEAGENSMRGRLNRILRV
jgi:hypothetical protein